MRDFAFRIYKSLVHAPEKKEEKKEKDKDKDSKEKDSKEKDSKEKEGKEKDKEKETEDKDKEKEKDKKDDKEKDKKSDKEDKDKEKDKKDKDSKEKDEEKESKEDKDKEKEKEKDVSLHFATLSPVFSSHFLLELFSTYCLCATINNSCELTKISYVFYKAILNTVFRSPAVPKDGKSTKIRSVISVLFVLIIHNVDISYFLTATLFQIDLNKNIATRTHQIFILC